MATIQFIQYSPEQLQVEISKGIKTQLDEFLKHYKPVVPHEYLSYSQVVELYGLSLKTVSNYKNAKIFNLYGFEGSKRVFFRRSEIESSLKLING
jgi:hypothetical protein